MPINNDDFNWDEKKKKIPILPPDGNMDYIIKSKSDLPETGRPTSGEMEVIDLHFEKIMDKRFHKDFSSAEILEMQKDAFKEFFEKSVTKKIETIIIIHGFGNGVLKKEVLKYLKKQKQFVSMYDASYKSFGMGGASKVELKYL